MDRTGENVVTDRLQSPPQGIRVKSRWLRNILTFFVVFGPGLIVMEADNDAGAVSTYTQAGGQYGLHLLWLMLLLLPVCYFIQEMVVRLGIATGQGHAAMIYQRFGKWWGRFSLFDLLLVNFLTLVTEFAAISLATQQMGMKPTYSVPIAAVLLVIHVISGSYKRWERITCILCLLDITWFVMAFFSHPSASSVVRQTLIPSVPPGGITTNLVFVVIAIIGTTIAPWQLFFQQSCVADKRLRFADLKWARLDTFLGACFTVTVAGAMIIVGNVSHQHGLTYEDPAKMANAILPFTNSFVRNAILLMFCNAAVLGTTAISLSSAWAWSETRGWKHSLNMPFKDAPGFYCIYAICTLLAASIVLIPGAPLQLIILAQRSFTSFDRGINNVSWLLIRFMLLIIPVVLLLNGFTKGDWGSSFLFALSVAVGLTPEMLPVVIAANLTRGAVAMARHRVIVKRLSSIEDLGSMNVLCIDKTGTLTIDQIILERHLDVLGSPDDEVLQYAYLNSYFQTGLKNLLDAAILEHGELHQTLRVSESFRKVDELPFDFGRRRMSVIVEKERQQHELICKGAVEEILAVCSYAKVRGKVVALSPELTSHVLQVCHEMNEEGLRVLAVGYKNFTVDQANHQYRVKDESDLVLAGFVAFLDPPKESTREALAALRSRGVEVKILTGDNELVARRICQWVDLKVEHAMLGSEVESMSDSELRRAVSSTSLFAKLAPLPKARVISALKAAGNTVGFLGDGINDAAALRESDVGISVDTAVDVAKESADIVMLEKSLQTLVNVVMEGRRNSANIVKYVKMAASSNFGNVFTVLGTSAFLKFLPMLPLQLLVQNLLYDLSQIAIPFDPVDQEDLVKPRRWEAQGIARFMLFLGPISSVFDIATFGVLWWIIGANTGEKQALFQSGWFVEGLLSQTLIVYMIRTRRIPFFQSRPCVPLLVTTMVTMAFGAVLPFLPIGSAIGLVKLPLVYFFWLGGILFGYCLLVQAVKTWFLHRFKTWI